MFENSVLLSRCYFLWWDKSSKLQKSLWKNDWYFFILVFFLFISFQNRDCQTDICPVKTVLCSVMLCWCKYCEDYLDFFIKLDRL